MLVKCAHSTVLIQLSGLLGTQDFKIHADNPKFWMIENIRITAETSINKKDNCCESLFLSTNYNLMHPILLKY